MKTYTFEVETTATAFTTITIDLPDGLTEDEVDARVQQAIDDADDDIIDDLTGARETSIFRDIEYPYAPPPPPDVSPLPIPESSWVVWNLRRWASDGDCLIREGLPPIKTSAERKPWIGSPGSRYPMVKASELDALMRTFHPPDGFDPLVHCRFAPLFAVAHTVETRGALGAVTLLDKRGDLLAIVMPVRADAEGEEFVRVSLLPRAS